MCESDPSMNKASHLEQAKREISATVLMSRIDTHFQSAVRDEKYTILDISPSELLTHNRLDLAIKILYLQMREFNVSFAMELYVKHIRAFTLGKFKEPGNGEKDSLQKYLTEFDSIYKSVSLNGIDENRSLIPLSQGRGIMNGAHRVSSAYFAGKTVPSVKLDIPDDQYDFNFFLQRGLSEEEIEIAATAFIETGENCYIALIWPSAQGHQMEIERVISNIIYKKNVVLNSNGAHNLLSQVYHNEPWLGSREKNYPGVQGKLIECFKSFGDLRVIAFQAPSLEQVLLIKEKIREIFSIGKHSIHISDTKEEAVHLARILFNGNSIHFLNHGKPNRFLSTHGQLEKFRKFLKKNDVQAEQAILDSSLTLSLYGLREARDIDYLAVKGQFKQSEDLIENHLDQLEFHNEEENELIWNNKFYFYYEGLKFVSFRQLYRMKNNRLEIKDKNDLILMKALLDNNKIKMWVATLKQKYFYTRVRLKIAAIDLSKTIGIYPALKCIYRALNR